MKTCLLLFAVAVSGTASAAPPTAAVDQLQIVPAVVPPTCDRRKDHKQILFDLCRDQSALLKEAQDQARASGKLVLVSYGADWCIWCHVFEAHILGRYGSFTYDTPDGPYTMQENDTANGSAAQAAAFKAFVARNFVVVNIAQEAGRSAEAVLKATAADKQFLGGLPFNYVLDRQGRFAGSIESAGVEVRRDTEDWYRGYDRAKLMAVLQSLAAASPK